MRRYGLIVLWQGQKTTEVLIILELDDMHVPINQILDDYANIYELDRSKMSGILSEIIKPNLT